MAVVDPPTRMATTTALREALNQGISTGCLVDTKVILYSHRDSSGRICRPRAVYANSHVLKTISFFKDCEFTATFNNPEEVYAIVSQYSSVISQSPGRKILRTQLTKKDLRKIMDTCLTVTLRTTKMRNASLRLLCLARP